MAGLNRLVMAYRPAMAGRKIWPVDVRWRLVVYVCLSVAAWVFPPWGAVGVALACLLLSRGLKWLPWLFALGWFWLIILSPLITGLWLWLSLPAQDPGELLAPAWRSLTFLVLLMVSQWLTVSTTLFEIQTGLAWVLRPLGSRLSLWLSFLASLAIGFVPWVLDEARAIQEATSLRGSGRRRLGWIFAGFGLPLFVRVFAKARHVAEAIELRGSIDRT